MTGKSTFLNDEDEDFFGADEESQGSHAEHEPRPRDVKRVHPNAARQRLDSRSEELWLKRQLSDWDESFEGDSPA